MLWTSYQNELKHLDYVCEKINDENFKERVKYYLRWYIVKSRHAKFWFYVGNILNIILPLVLTFISTVDKENNLKVVTIVIPLIISFINGILILGRFLDKWNNYRTCVTLMNLFLNDYLDKQNEQKFVNDKYKLHREFDKIVQNEGKNWKKIQDKLNEQAGDINDGE